MTLTRIGAPIASNNLLFCVIYILLTRVIAEFGDPAVAAVGVGHRIEGLAYFPCVGFATAAATLVGQHLGARQPAAAARAAWLATGYAAGIVACASLLYIVFAEPVYRIFAADGAVIEVGVSYLRIIALFETAMALEVVLEGAFAGAGNAVPPMVISVPLTFARIPAARWLSRSLRVAGIWWAISISTLVKGLAIAAWFRVGRWKRTAV